MASLPPEDNPHRGIGGSVLGCVVQQNVRHLLQVLLAALDKEVFLHIAFQRQPLLKIHRLERQQGVAHQLAEIQTGKNHVLPAVIHPRQLQQTFHQSPHLVGHGHDAVHEPAARLFVVLRLLQKLRVGQNHRQGCFQLMRGVRYELALLVPRRLHRLHRPPCQQEGQPQKYGEAQHADEDTGIRQTAHGGKLAGHIHKDDGLPEGRGALLKAQAVVLQDAGLVVGIQREGDDLLNGLRVRQVIVAAKAGGQLAHGVDTYIEIGKLRLSGKFPRTAGIGAILHDALHHPDALLFQIIAGKVEQHTENRQHHNGDDGHIDADEFDSQSANHPSATSRRYPRRRTASMRTLELMALSFFLKKPT